MRVNLGCGQSPTPGWLNLDNSWTVRISPIPLFAEVLAHLGILGDDQLSFAQAARDRGIQYGDAVRGLPLPDSSVDVLYSSHMLEHLGSETEVPAFLSEARRILAKDGIIRLAVPDLRQQAEEYVQTGNANRFLERTLLACKAHRSLWERLKFLISSHRHHLWMYDGASLCRLLEEAGFTAATVVQPGETRISDPGLLDLRERAEESVYVEAVSG